MSKSNSSSKDLVNVSFEKENSNKFNICCSKCQTLCMNSIIIKKNPESKGFKLNITCKNNHTEETPLNKFTALNGKMFIKKCQNCNKIIGIKNIYFCFKCKKYFCLNCKCEHYEEKDCITNYYGLLENRCSLHNNRIKEFYCQHCVKYLCKECVKNNQKSHNNNIINLMEKFDNYQKLMKNDIQSEKNLVIRYNKILNSVREIITKNIEQKKLVLDIKKNILNSYINNNKNYFNNKNIDFAKNQLNDNIKYDQTRIKKLYDFCKNKYMNSANKK